MDENLRSDTVPSHPQPPPGKVLEFITFTNPDVAKNARNRQLVRRQAMRDFHGRLDDSRRRRNEHGLTIIPSRQMDLQSQEAILESSQHRTNEGVIVPNLVNNLGVSRVDPFFQYPVRMGHRERELYDHRG
jgi:hypothetical protein